MFFLPQIIPYLPEYWNLQGQIHDYLTYQISKGHDLELARFPIMLKIRENMTPYFRAFLCGYIARINHKILATNAPTGANCTREKTHNIPLRFYSLVTWYFSSSQVPLGCVIIARCIFSVNYSVTSFVIFLTQHFELVKLRLQTRQPISLSK